MLVRNRLFTVEDLAYLPENGRRYEVIEGERYITLPPHAEHRLVLGAAIAALGGWHDETDLGYAVSGSGVVLSRHDCVIPDPLWFSDDRLSRAMINPATGSRDGRFYWAPDLAIELLERGQADEERDCEVKLSLYSRCGVREYWIVDRFTRTIAVYRRTAEALLELAITLTDRDTLASPLLPGFAVPVERLFRLPKSLPR